MLLFSSEKGVFENDRNNLSPALNCLFQKAIENVKIVKRSGDATVNESWRIIMPTSEEFKNAQVTIDDDLLDKIRNKRASKVYSRDGGEGGKGDRDDIYEKEEEGHWVLLETEVVSSGKNVSPKLIKTKWGQTEPWNIYTPLLLKDGSYEHAAVGCVAVAAAQYQYFTHYKDGVPMSTVDKATLTSDGHDYVFSGNSSSIWDKMALNFYNSGTEYSALLMGYVGRNVKTKYGLKSSEATPANLEKYLETVYGVDFNAVDPTFKSIRISINKYYPVLARANSSDGGHRFIIDQYYYSWTTTKYTYGWEGPYDPTGSGVYEDTNDRDEDGNIVGWAVQKEFEMKNSREAISMNWGWEGLSDDVLYYSLKEWKAGPFTFNSGFKTLERSDVK